MNRVATLLAAVAIALTGCGRQDTARSSGESAAQSAGAAAGSGTRASTSATNVASGSPSENWAELRTYSYDRRGEFNSALNAMSAKVDAEIATLQSKSTAAGNADNKVDALREVREAKAEFDGKAAALGRANEARWDAARDEVAQAWDRLQEALRQARAAS